MAAPSADPTDSRPAGGGSSGPGPTGPAPTDTGPTDGGPPRDIPDRRRSLLVAGMIGVGLMAAVDEIVFHQILGWHHFYDRSTPEIGLLSDGLLHSAELVVLVAGFYLFSDLRRRAALHRTAAWSGLLLGAGAFQLWDGVVDHKVLRLHQVRYDVDLLPYDVAWIGAALMLLAAGAVVGARAGRRR